MLKPLATLASALVLAAGLVGTAAARAPMPEPDAANPAVREAAMPLPNAAQLFRQVARSGVTKPAGAALDARLGTKPGLEAESRRLDRLIRTSVCTGC